LKERLLNHADAEQIATILEQAAYTSVGINDLTTSKFPSHIDGDRIIAALSALKDNNAFCAEYVFDTVTEMQTAIQNGEVKNNAIIYVKEN